MAGWEKATEVDSQEAVADMEIRNAELRLEMIIRDTI